MTAKFAEKEMTGYANGQREERKRILRMLEAEMRRFEEHPYKLGEFDTQGLYLGLRMAHLHVKEMKWT